jgi:ribose transport system substrate-binding protein
MRKRIFLILLILVISCYFTGCTNNKNIDNTEIRKNIDFIVKSRSGDYWNVVKAGAEAAAKEFNINLNYTAPDFEYDIDTQISLVNRAIDRKVDSIVLAASDFNELVPSTENAYNSKIPVIIVDSEVNTNKISGIIATDNLEAGKKVGKKAVEVFGDKTQVAIINYVKGSASADKREEGVLSILSSYPEIKVIAKEYSLSDEKKAAEITKKIIKENPGIKGLIALNAATSNGVAQAIDELSLGGKVKFIAFDCTPEEVEYIEKGVIQATVIQNPFTIGYLGVKYAAMAARGSDIPKVVDTGSKIIDKGNMYLPENQKLVFPFFR